MREELERMCIDTRFSRTSFCVDYGTKECKKTCYYARHINKVRTRPNVRRYSLQI